MNQPQMDDYEFITAEIFNTAFSQLVTAIRQLASGEVFFQPGLISAASLQFTFHSTLIVDINAPSPFGCLFGTGALSSALGTTDGSQSSAYSVNFVSLVPSVGSTTVYVVASYASVQENPFTILGPPPGHPDYSAQFQPYTAYSTLNDSINITLTTTVPDNIVYLELGRVTLTANQSSVNSIDTSNQIAAAVVVPPLNGDVSGSISANTLVKIQGKIVSASAPLANQVLVFTGSAWSPTTLVLSGDITGSLSSTSISKLQGKSISASSPTTNQILQYNGSTWVPITLPTSYPPTGPAGGDLYNTFPNPNVGKIRTIPVNSTAPTDQQVLTYVAANSDIEWKTQSQSIVGSTSKTLSSPINLTAGTLANILSITLTMPSTPGSYVVDLRWNQAIANQAGITYTAGIGCNLLAGSTVFGYANSATNANGATHIQGISGSAISPVYSPSQTVTFILQTIQYDSNDANLQVQAGATTYLNGYIMTIN